MSTKNRRSKIFKKTAISPIITTVLLIVICVIIITAILNWGQIFTNSSLDNKTKDIKTLSKSDAENFVYPRTFTDNVMQFNYAPPNYLESTQILIEGYKILATGYESELIEITPPKALSTGLNILELVNFSNLNITAKKFDVIFYTSDDKYITLLDITNPYSYIELSSANYITSFTILETSGDINSDLNTIDFNFPYGTNITNINPTITISENATVNPETGIAQDFTNPIEYTVTAENETTRTYTVTVSVSDIPEGIGPTPIDGEIWYLEHLDYIDTNATTLAGTYTLMRDLDFDNDASYYNISNKTIWADGNGWEPIGTLASHFAGSFDGNNYTISNLYINRPTTDNIGLFGDINATITNISLEEVYIIGKNYVGALIGEGAGNLVNCNSSGFVSGTSSIGGISGYSFLGDLNFCSSSCVISASTDIAGGLVGWGMSANIYNSYASGDVSGVIYVGGLIGSAQFNTTISKSFATGDVSGTDYVGGLVGISEMYTGNITNSYSLGNVIRSSGSKTTNFGGFIGYIDDAPGICTNNYSIGSVSGSGWTPTIKGFSGNNLSTGSSGNFWDITTSGQTTSGTGATGKTTTQMKTQSTFTGWNFSGVWNINEGTTYPYLRANTQSPLPQ